jgi:hypothetical protein
VSDKPSWKKFEALLGDEVEVSLINQPINFVVDFEAKAGSALDIAQQRWRCEPELISGDRSERHKA